MVPLASDIDDVEEGIHWFKLNRDGSIFMVLHQADGRWVVIEPVGVISSERLREQATYIRPAESPPGQVN